MKEVTPTTLRRKAFRIAAPVAEKASAKDPGRLARLKRRRLISGEASTLWKVKTGTRRVRAS